MLTKIPVNEQPKYLNLIEKFTCMVNKFNQIEKSARDYGTGALLYPSEIHLIESIGKNPGIHVTALAQKQGISKAAISQKLKTLEKKQLIERFKERFNDKTVRVKLKIKGEVAFKGHENFHSVTDSVLIRKINELPPDSVGTFENLLDAINRYADSLLIK
jgi:DNA-binding MarR family transcriptional regulator